MWNIAHNLGGFGAPVLAGTAARALGWRWGMWAPGAVGLAVGALLLLAVRDSPEAVGYPPVEIVAPAKQEEGAAAAAGPKPSLLELLVKNVLRNPYIWGMALTYFFVYVVRQVRSGGGWGGVGGGGGGGRSPRARPAHPASRARA